MQVSGHIGKTLLDAIRESIVPRPPLMGWNAWQRWRSTEGLRPTARVDGASNSTTSAQELQFWKAAMLEVYGEDWSYQIALAQASEPEEEGGLDEDDAQEEELGGRSAAGPPSVSPAPGAEQTRRVWRSTSPPIRTSDEDGERNLARAREVLPARLAAGSTSLGGASGLLDGSELPRYDPMREPLEGYQNRIRRSRLL